MKNEFFIIDGLNKTKEEIKKQEEDLFESFVYPGTYLRVVSNMMVVYHDAWVFINDLKKGVLPNKKASTKEKVKYLRTLISHHASFAEELDFAFLTNSFNDIGKEIELIWISNNKNRPDSYNPNFYYDCLPVIGEIEISRKLFRGILFHLCEFYTKAISPCQVIINSQKISEEDIWKKCSNILEKFIERSVF